MDASGAEGSSPSSLLASLQSPSQLFSADNLSALISAQLGQGAADPTQSPTDPARTTSAQPNPTQEQPPTGAIHRRHHHLGGSETADPSGAQSSDAATEGSEATTAAATAGVSATEAQTEMSQLLTGM